jgi:hypothetical protein
MKQAKQKPLPFVAEYRLLIYHKYSPQFKAMVIRVVLRTIDEFSNFLYEIVVEDIIKGNTLSLNIHGLRAPRQTLPAFGPATFTKEYRNLEHVEEIVVAKLDGMKNTFHVKISKDSVILKKSPKDNFVQLVTKEEEW